jgi:hypothetical protein
MDWLLLSALDETVVSTTWPMKMYRIACMHAKHTHGHGACGMLTLESRLSLHVLPRAVGAPRQAHDDRSHLALCRVRDGDRHQHSTDAEEHPS